MPDATEKIQWHPAFYDAMKAELVEYKQYLSFITERQLTTEPLRMDLLIIKKLRGVKIEKNIGRIFRRDNIMEYKAPGDSLSVSDYNKVFGYAYIYAYLEKLDIMDITLTFVTTSCPESVFLYLDKRAGISVLQESEGIYYVHNEIMPVQIVATKYLRDEENLWLTSLTDKLKSIQFERVVQERQKLAIKIDALLYAMAVANTEVVKEEYKRMGDSLGTVLAEIGFIDKSVLEKEKKRMEDERARIKALAAEKVARLAMKAELEKIGKAKAEEERAKAEEERAKAEEERTKAEEGKVKAEEERVIAEEGRVKAEEGRVKAEEERIKTEEERIKTEAENLRLKNTVQKAKADKLESIIAMLRFGMPAEVISKCTSTPLDEIQQLQADIDLSLDG